MYIITAVDKIKGKDKEFLHAFIGLQTPSNGLYPIADLWLPVTRTDIAIGSEVLPLLRRTRDNSALEIYDIIAMEGGENQ